eukprot:gene6174-biopygen2387
MNSCHEEGVHNQNRAGIKAADPPAGKCPTKIVCPSPDSIPDVWLCNQDLVFNADVYTETLVFLQFLQFCRVSEEKECMRPSISAVEARLDYVDEIRTITVTSVIHSAFTQPPTQSVPLRPHSEEA